MKTIKERAKSYARKVWCGGVRDFVNHKKATELDFIAGAQSEREELTRWHNPKDSPERGKDVLLKIQLVGNDEPMYSVGYWYDSYFSNTFAPHSEVIGWRPIYENE
ncbi:hypothetical protein [Alistipes putredinis]|jgi:hypothetical protein|uniref:hypothetical protein n=1 Tax=Alistipes putredinis TaxID=28117 RepID=UPI003A8435CB